MNSLKKESRKSIYDSYKELKAQQNSLLSSLDYASSKLKISILRN